MLLFHQSTRNLILAQRKDIDSGEGWAEGHSKRSPDTHPIYIQGVGDMGT